MNNLGYNLLGESMIVKNIKFINGKVEVEFENKKIFLSKENYIQNPLTIDSEISEEKIKFLLEYEQVIESKTYLIKVLNKKALSEHQIYLKLKESNLSSKYIKEVIEDLKRAGLVNDEFVATITVDGMLVKRKGKKEIIRELNEKRIAEEIIDRVIEEIDEDVYMNNFNKVVDKYKKIYDNKGSQIKKSFIKQKLLEQGYEREIVDKIEIENDENRELELAKKNLLKIIKGKNNDLNDYETVNKIKAKLAMKGFGYDIINLALEEVKENETY